MKKTEAELASLFEEQVSFIFEDFKKLPNYGQANPTFLARPRKSDTYDKIKGVLSHLKSDVSVESFNSTGDAHVIQFNSESRIVIIYADSAENFPWLYNYHSYSSSIILGKILKRAGVKYSEKGLQYLQHDLRPNHQSVVGSYTFTKDFDKILDILKLDKEEYHRGFKTMEDLFAFIVKCPFLDVSIFSNPEKEQKSYLLQKFEEYLIVNNVSREFEKLTFEHVRSFFPEVNFEEISKILLEKAEKKKTITDKFSGRVILNHIPDLNQKKLGISMAYFKHSFNDVFAFEEFMSEHSEEEFIQKFKEVNQL